MNFCFNFNQPDSDLGKPEQTTTPQEECKLTKEIYFKSKYGNEQRFNLLKVRNGLEISYVSSQNIEDDIAADDSEINRALKTESDLLPGVYEGGLKIWECSLDLLEYLSANEADNLKDKVILELGCGVGLPGIYAAASGAIVHFQDFNDQVINLCTIPSLCATLKTDVSTEASLNNCRFFAGDWSTFKELLCSEEQRYDMIITSETIYNQGSYEKLHALFEATLKRTGRIYIAAKTCYFGVGGGTRSFEGLLEKKSVFDFSTVLTVESGVHREILKLTFKEKGNPVT